MLNKVVRAISVCVLLVTSVQSAFAADPVEGKINNIITYTTFGSGDVVFSLEASVNGCDNGYWLRKNDPGFNSTLSTLLSAYHAKTTVKVFGHDDQLWNGSNSGKYCRLDWLRLID